jgi:hypothetical protein
VSGTCPNCGYHVDAGAAPEEPARGAWVKDRFGAVHQRSPSGGWGQPGLYGFGKWELMWQARGPLVECGPWGREL